jgi:hypothetical protein
VVEENYIQTTKVFLNLSKNLLFAESNPGACTIFAFHITGITRKAKASRIFDLVRSSFRQKHNDRRRWCDTMIIHDEK